MNHNIKWLLDKVSIILYKILTKPFIKLMKENFENKILSTIKELNLEFENDFIERIYENSILDK